ncbi:MAG: 2-hydroxyacid dehydrogenase [Chloroflexi bacterium]|nr:2-hydroxyacid dehydrogenase [Chloroflexota bacterium]
MRVAIFSTKPYDKRFFEEANQRLADKHGSRAAHELGFFETRLTAESVSLAFGIPAVCAFVNDELDPNVLSMLSAGETKLVALRCAGFNNVNVAVATQKHITLARVPAYSPHAVAEHAIGLILALNRKIHRAYARVREGNFALEGLLGFDLHGRTVGVVGTGRIGAITAEILKGFGCRVLLNDMYPNAALATGGAEYVSMEQVLAQSDVITLHCPLTPETHHLINAETLAATKPGVMIINTSRGALIDAVAAIEALKSGHLGYLGLDVYEEESDLFFRDLSDRVIQDDVFSRLLTFPNVLITGHQAFFTHEAMESIADATLANIRAFERGESLGENEVTPEMVK